MRRRLEMALRSARSLCTGLGLFAVLSTALPAQAAESVRKFVLVLGENEGLTGEERLRFAEDDARRFLETLVEVGGAAREDSLALYGTDAASVRAALTAFGTRLRSEATPRDWLVVYISSHASDGALHLAGTELPVGEVVEFLRTAPVGVGMLVLDSCRSGAATRLKGLKAAGGPVKSVEAADLEGRVILSSSGADEYAQESDELEGSTFTHHLLAALRGAADSSQDGRVTLEEAYGYAYARTLESSVASSGGIQRPSFRKDLRGRGDLVVSEPLRAKGRVLLGVEAPGRWLVVAERGGSLVAELEKGEGPRTLALPPGRYRLKLRGEAGFLERSIEVPAEGGLVRVEGEEFERVSRQRLAMKGGIASERYRLTLLGEGSSGVVAGLSSTFGGSARLRREARLFGPLELLSLSLSGRTGTTEGYRITQREFELRGGVGPRLRSGRFELSLLAEVGALAVSQSDLPDGSSRFGLAPVAGATVELRFSVSAPWSLSLLGHGGAAYLRRDSGLALQPRGTVGFGVGFDL